MTDPSRAALRAVLDSRWSDLEEQIRKALAWTPGTAITATADVIADQLWTLITAERALADEAIPREAMGVDEFSRHVMGKEND